MFSVIPFLLINPPLLRPAAPIDDGQRPSLVRAVLRPPLHRSIERTVARWTAGQIPAKVCSSRMTFPVYLRFGGFVVHPHWVFETLAYAVGLYWSYRSRRRSAMWSIKLRRAVNIAALAGGLIGSRLLAAFEGPRTRGAAGSGAARRQDDRRRADWRTRPWNSSSGCGACRSRPATCSRCR